jgi:hypothetical protein
MLRRGLGPAGLVAAVVVVTWLVSGVALDEIIRFLGYEVAFVALPGIAVLWAVRGRRPGFLAMVAIGWPIGQTLEILAFIATAAAGVRGLFLIYPVVVLAGSALPIWRRRDDVAAETDSGGLTTGLMWTAAGAISLGIAYLALMFLPQVPLPSATSAVGYSADFPYFIGLIGQVVHHWPPTSPGLSGVPLHYEWFVFYHMAAANQVTQVPIATIALRLDYVPTIVVIACQLLAVGRLLARSAWTGVIAIALVFLLGPLDFTTDTGGSSPFFDLFSAHLLASWTFPFGLMFFLALLYLIGERLRAQPPQAGGALPAYALIVLLMVGASGAKATVLPVIIAGTGLYAVVTFVARRRIPVAAVVTVVIGIVVFAGTYLAVYGGGAPGTAIQPLAALARTAPVIFAHTIRSHSLRLVAVPIAYAAGLAGMLLPLAGMLYLLRRRHWQQIALLGLCICTFAAGLLVTNVVYQLGYSELYFQDTGYVAGCVAAAAGLRLMWVDAGNALCVSRRALVVTMAASLVLLILLIIATSRALTHPHALVVRYVGLAVGCVILVSVWSLVLRASHRPAPGILAVGLVPLVAAAALASPIEVSPTIRAVLTRSPVTTAAPDPQVVWGMTPGLFSALTWLRQHSPVDVVLAVSNHWITPLKTDGRYYYYSAFSERQVFVEAYDPIRYGITTHTSAAFRNFAMRRQLNDQVFNDADVNALRMLTQQYAVRFLLIDRIHGSVDPNVLQLGRVVFSNRDATIVAVG